MLPLTGVCADYRPGAVIVKDSKKSDYIFVVMSVSISKICALIILNALGKLSCSQKVYRSQFFHFRAIKDSPKSFNW